MWSGREPDSNPSPPSECQDLCPLQTSPFFSLPYVTFFYTEKIIYIIIIFFTVQCYNLNKNKKCQWYKKNDFIKRQNRFCFIPYMPIFGIQSLNISENKSLRLMSFCISSKCFLIYKNVLSMLRFWVMIWYIRLCYKNTVNYIFFLHLIKQNWLKIAFFYSSSKCEQSLSYYPSEMTSLHQGFHDISKKTVWAV